MLIVATLPSTLILYLCPANSEVPSVIRFLNAKGERPAEIHKQIVAVLWSRYDFEVFLHLKKHLAGKKSSTTMMSCKKS
jgi:hypothetical protein